MAEKPPQGHYIQRKASEFQDTGQAGVEESLLSQPHHMVQQDGGIDHEKDYGRYHGRFFLVPQGQPEQKSRNHGYGEIRDIEGNRGGVRGWLQPHHVDIAEVKEALEIETKGPQTRKPVESRDQTSSAGTTGMAATVDLS